MDAETQYTTAAKKAFAGEPMPADNPMIHLGTELLSEFEQAKTWRREIETRWLMDLRQYKGVYEPEVEKAIADRSKAFLRKTRVKVESVDARLADLLFPANRERNYEIDATPDPKVPPEIRAGIRKALIDQSGQEPDRDTLRKAVRAYVAEAAKRMAIRIDDQLVEAKYKDHCRKAMHSGNLYGTGILKGPLVERRTRIRYVWDGRQFVQKEESFASPFVSYVPLWRWYPDMAVTELKDCRYTWEHHRLSRADLVELMNRKSYRRETIKAHIETHETGYIKLMSYESELQTMTDSAPITGYTHTGQYDVYERWGWLTASMLAGAGIEVPQERMHEAFFANIWMLPDGEVIKAVLAPIEGVEWPYHLYYFDKDETSIFGEGIPSVMRSDQEIINAVARMLLDNSAQTAGDMYEVYVTAFPPGADLTSIHPGKVFPRTGGDMQYPAVRRLSSDNHADKLLPLLQLFDANADETTAIPKFTYGENPKQGAAGTVGGLSMLLGQANISLKDLVANFDEGITVPFISGVYHWNMKFGRDMSIKGDYDVHARGASSLVAKEMKSQMLGMFGGTLQPEERPFIKWDKLVEQKCEALDLHGIVKTPEDVEQDMKDPMLQQQQQLAMAQQQLLVEKLKGEVGKLQGQISEMAAKTENILADAIDRRIKSVFSAMQAAGVAASNPTIAPAGDAILQSAGWQDATPQQPGSGAEQAIGAPIDQQAVEQLVEMQPEEPEPLILDEMGDPIPRSPNVGQEAGIETPVIEQ